MKQYITNKLLPILLLTTGATQTESPQTLFEQGNRAHQEGRYDDAEKAYRSVLNIIPDEKNTLYNLAFTYRLHGKMNEAAIYYGEVLKQTPDNASAHYGLAESQLMLGNLVEGFEHFEWRYKRGGEARNFSDKLWDGSNLTNKTILIRGEYGLGDTLQFIRYASMLKEQGAYIIAEVQTPLIPLLSRLPYLDKIIPVVDHAHQLPYFDFQTPIMSLPRYFKTSVTTVPAPIPYLQADPNLVNAWYEQLAQDTNFKIGIVWDPSPYFETFKNNLSKKTVSLAEFAPLAQLKGVSLYSLQQMNGTEQLAHLPEGFHVHTFGADFDASHGRFMDTAAVIKSMDLIVCVDTSVTHLAGALGAQVWMLLPVVADWRWMEKRSDSPWYPTMRIFRQTTAGDWTSVMSQVTDELKKILQPAQQNVTTEVAVGELVDKITILEIKKQKIKDTKKLQNIENELNALNSTFNFYFYPSATLMRLKNDLRTTNKSLWDIEDAIREKERTKNFDDEFITLARGVYITNDQRCAIKRKINELVGSRLIEEKSYTPYK